MTFSLSFVMLMRFCIAHERRLAFWISPGGRVSTGAQELFSFCGIEEPFDISGFLILLSSTLKHFSLFLPM